MNSFYNLTRSNVYVMHIIPCKHGHVTRSSKNTSPFIGTCIKTQTHTNTQYIYIYNQPDITE